MIEARGGGAADRRLPSPWLLFPAVAALAMLPELVFGLSVSSSARYNATWTAQFVDLVRAGNPYPRWLPLSWDGFGSPTFYFYPPVFFWIAALIDLLTLGALRENTLVSLASTAMMALSGLAMFLWLRGRAPPAASLAAAVAWMVAPWHLFDIYSRGAVAEASIYAVLPLVLLGVRQIGEGLRFGPVLLASSYAALAMTHLPLAMLASLTLIPLYVLFLATRPHVPALRFLVTAGLSGAVGVALAAIYLLPALTLLDRVSADALTGPFYRPRYWFFDRLHLWGDHFYAAMLVAMVLAALAFAAAIHRGRSAERSGEASFWAGFAILTVIFITGALPFLWRLPLIEAAQFPFRFLVLTEFAVITGLALVRPPLRSAWVRVATLAMIPAAALAIAFCVRSVPDEPWRTDMRDAPEYLPAGAPIRAGPFDIPEPRLVELPTSGLVTPDGPARLAASARPDGGIDIDLAPGPAATLTARRHFFPNWRVEADGRPLQSFAAGPQRLLAFTVPEGARRVTVRSATLPVERTGALVSAAALLLLAAYAIAVRRRRLLHD